MAAATGATSSFKTFLMKSTDGSTYTKLIDIKSYGDLGGTPETLETTTLSDRTATNILGQQSMDQMEFTCNYIPADYASLKAVEAATASTPGKFAIWFGGTENLEAGTVTPTGDDGKFSFEGQLSVYVTGKGVNEVREMVVSIAASTAIAYTSGT